MHKGPQMKKIYILFTLSTLSSAFAGISCRGEIYIKNKKQIIPLEKTIHDNQVQFQGRKNNFEFFAEHLVPFNGIFLQISSDTEGVITEATSLTLPASLVGAAEEADVILDCKK